VHLLLAVVVALGIWSSDQTTYAVNGHNVGRVDQVQGLVSGPKGETFTNPWIGVTYGNHKCPHCLYHSQAEAAKAVEQQVAADAPKQ
jgi:hypothetical protein